MRRNPAFFTRIQHQALTVLLLFVTIVSQLTFLEFLKPQTAEAAVVTIDNAASATTDSFQLAGSQTVFIDDQIGYKFYRDATGICVYSKTSDGGGVWAPAVTIDAQTDCIALAVWYDQWTPGDFGTYIHIVTMENGSNPDHLFYNRLDTTSDTRLMGTAPVNVTTNSSQVGTFTAGTNVPAITKGTDGEVYITTADASDSFVVSCTTNCNLTTGWTQTGSNFLDVTNDWNIMVPLLGGSILLINRDISADDIRSRVWDGASWSASWNNVDTGAIESGTYDVGMAATIDHVTGDVFLAYAADNDNFTVADHDIRTAKFSSGSWSATTNVLTNMTGGLHHVAIALDTNSSNVYVTYVHRTTLGTATTGNVYYSTSTSAMSSWSPQSAAVNLVAQNLYGINTNIMSDERIYATWYDPNLDDVLGETIADIAPITKLTTRGTPSSTINASSSNVWIGGTFVIRESQSSRNVTDIVVNERGTVAGNTAIENVRLQYDLDTSAPYDCASESYGGSETQFGTTDTNGFSGTDGISAFAGLVGISTTQAMCVYVVMDINDTASDGDTLSVSVESPNDDVLVTGGVDVMPVSPVRFSTSTEIRNDKVTQTGFHWRNDNGNETGATSATQGVENTSILALQTGTPRRLRIGVSNEGSLAAPASTYRLEYAPSTGTCSTATGWTDVGATDDAWNMSNSTFITDGANTTNIATSSGGVTDQNTTFLAANGGLRDTSSQTGSLTLSNTNFVDLEFSVVASSSAVEGTTYCFRITAAGSPLPVYSIYPEVTITADLSVTATGTATVSTLIPATDFYTGGAFVLRENVATRTITSITIAATGTIDLTNDITNIKLRYDLDTTAPYNCASESYNGTEPQYGATSTGGFSLTGTSTFDGSLAVSTTSIMCLYVVLDILDTALNGETLQLSIRSASTDVVVNDGSVSPSTAVSISGTTTLQGALVTQTGYHWRNNDGTEAGASSATLGSENAPYTDMTQNTPIRLRLGISNEGAATSATSTYRLEFGPKLTTCQNIGVWSPVGAINDDWNMYDSVNLTEGNNTTNIATSTGGVADGNPSFLATNGGVRDTTSTTSQISLTTTQFTEFEFSITSTNITAFSTTYCFRVTANGTPLPTYSQYAEITMGPKRDFVVRRGVTAFTGTSTTLIAGVDYVAPASSSTAFVRITDTHHTGAGDTAAGGGALNARDVTAHISNATDLTTSFTISRPTGALADTRVTWEIVEFTGDPGTDNEMKVRGVGTLSYTATALVATGTAVTVDDDADVVVFVTGISNTGANRNVYYAGQVTAAWSSSTNQPVLSRGANGSTAITASYAVVEYTGQNWRVQRVEHTYSTTSVETQSITPVNSLARTFIHTQKRMGALGNVNNYGHEVWLSSIGAVSFRLEPLATTPASHVSVAWIIENQQTSAGAMKVQRSNGTTENGTEPVTIPISIFTPIDSVTNTSIFSVSRVVGANTNFPLVFAGARITGTSTYELWRSEASALLTYRTEIVEWPINGLAVRQNRYRFYVDNNALTPSDPWPPGIVDLGENTVLSSTDEPLGDGDRVRIRMTYRVANAMLPAGLYDFKLQYGLRSTPSCTAIENWTDLGAAGSGAIWRGYAATGTTNGAFVAGNPPLGGELLITSVSDVGGNLVEENPSPGNPYLALAGEDVEYDWFVEHNGAIERSFYCFRMVRSDGTALDGYLDYPQIRTAGYSPVTRNWRFYGDENNETPTTALSAETIAPIEVTNQDVLALRVTVGERKNVEGQNVKFKLQYDESASFTNPRDVVATSTCTATSTWCYAAGAGIDNATITTKVLSDSDSCTGSVGNGCGTHNSSGTFVTGFTHPAGANREFSFYIRHAAARVGAVYYFRLYETFTDSAVGPASGESYPSLVAETAKLTLTVNGLAAGTTTAGVTLTASSTPAAITYGSLPVGVDDIAAHRITVDTNATEGYRVLMQARQQLLNTYGTQIAPITGTNASPVSWGIGCSVSADGCAGYHTTDATLRAPSSTRFAALDTYAGLSTSTVEIMYSPIPANDIHDIVYRVRVGPEQPAGDYETEIIYIAIPTY